MNFGRFSQDNAIRVARDALGQLANPFRLPGWLAELKDREVLRADIIAGLTVALILIPQSMAYAQLAGLPPHYGLYASLLPPMIAAFFGSSRQLATGPVAMVSLMTAAALAPLATAGTEAFVGYALLLALMVGLFQLSMGMFRLGVLLNFLSHPVVLGFVNAAAIIIATSQLGKIFGVNAQRGDHHYQYVLNTLQAAAEHTHWPTLGMAILAFGIMYWLRRHHPRLPFVLVAVLVTTVLAWLLGFEKHRTVQLSQINNKEIRIALIYDALQATHIQNQEEKYRSARRAYEQARQGSTEESAELLTMRQQLEQSRFVLGQLRAEVEAHHRELYDTPLYSVGEGEAMRLFTREEILAIGGEESKVYGQDWHIVSYRNDVVELQAGGEVLGHIPRGLPGVRLPSFDWAAIRHLIGAAIVISLIGFMEAVSIARTLEAQKRQHLDVDRELMGQGLSNLVGSMFQAAPVAGSFSRSAVNANAGAVTGFSAVVASLAVAATLLFLTPLLYYLPEATLAAVIILAVAGLVNVKPILHAWRTNRHDGVVAIVTFVLTLAMAPELEMGILFGMLLSLILLLFRAMQPRVVFPGNPEDLMPADAVASGATSDRRIVRLRFDGSLIFANVGFFEEQVQALLASTPELQVLIIDGVSITDVDASGEMVLRETFKRLQDAGITVLFTRFKRPIMEIFKRTHLRDDIGKEFFHRHPARAYDKAWALLRGKAQSETST
ncbi:MAG: SulP family inorganic anion transporter [Xanthomonadales bacterium]|nr:SulP family inorganic anion transporter [Xanthomonadales bacterium]